MNIHEQNVNILYKKSFITSIIFSLFYSLHHLFISSLYHSFIHSFQYLVNYSFLSWFLPAFLPSIYLSFFYLSIYLSIYPSIYLSIYPSIYLSIHLSIQMYPFFTSFPFPTDTYHPLPIHSVVRPLTSTGLFSPPASLPSVQLPNHPPLSPIPHQLPAVPVSPAQAGEQVDRLAVQLELTNLSSSGEPEWDNYFRTPPTYNDQREFWDSRYEA